MRRREKLIAYSLVCFLFSAVSAKNKSHPFQLLHDLHVRNSVTQDVLPSLRKQGASDSSIPAAPSLPQPPAPSTTNASKPDSLGLDMDHPFRSHQRLQQSAHSALSSVRVLEEAEEQPSLNTEDTDRHTLQRAGRSIGVVESSVGPARPPQPKFKDRPHHQGAHVKFTGPTTIRLRRDAPSTIDSLHRPAPSMHISALPSYRNEKGFPKFKEAPEVATQTSASNIKEYSPFQSSLKDLPYPFKPKYRSIAEATPVVADPHVPSRVVTRVVPRPTLPDVPDIVEAPSTPVDSVTGECAPGYGRGEGDRVCSACGPGLYSTGGSGPCSRCPAGTFSHSSGATICTPCPTGEVSAAGDTQCLMCPSGYIPNHKQSTCTECPQGRWSVAGGTVCQLCPRGTFNAERGKPGCIDCGYGLYNDHEGSVHSDACKPCPAGYVCPSKATPFPITCEETFISGPRAHVCKPCPSMFESDDARLKCHPTKSFIFIVIASMGFVIVALAAVYHCPNKEWGTRHRRMDPIL